MPVPLPSKSSDILVTAKALGCGVPVGAFLMTEQVAANSLTSGDHGTTYGGNPLAAAAINIVLDLFEENHILENVHSVAPYLEEKLDALAAQRFRRDQNIRLHPILLPCIHVAGTPHAALYFIQYQQNILRY